MSLNYYQIYDECPHCGRKNVRHIGKLTGGWKFLFQGYRYPDDPERWFIKTAEDWRQALNGGDRIEDEYGREVTVDELFDLVERMQILRSHAREYPDYYRTDHQGYEFHDGEFS